MRREELEHVFGDDPDSPLLSPIEEHLVALATERRLPVVALGACTARIEESGPPLRSILARAADGERLSDEEATLLFRGLHILGAARDRETWPILLRLLRQPPEVLDDLLGDGVTETLSRIVAGVFNGDVDALFDAIIDRRLDEYVRDALLGAATFMTWEGRIDRARMEGFLERFHADRAADAGDYLWVGWLNAVALLGIRRLAPLVEQVWREDLLPERVLEPSDFESDLVAAEREPDNIARFERDNLGHIDDIHESLAWTDYDAAPVQRRSREQVWDDFAPVSEPIVNAWRHVGRNDPCPCGSGRKAKKCCLGQP